MDALAWYNTLPDPVKQVLLGLASKVAGNLLDAGGYVVKKAFRSEPKQQALDRAMAQALLVTAGKLTDDPDLITHYVGLLAAWTEQEEVAGELSQLIEPQPEVELDLDLLTAAFEALDFEPDLLHEELDFPQVVAIFASAFYDAAAAETELDGPIKIGLLRGIAERTELLVKESRALRQEARRTRKAAERMQPELGLDQLERAYLRGLYAECNDLPLAGPPPDKGGHQPRMQKVYVDLRTGLSPNVEQILDRLRVPASERAAPRKALEKRERQMEGGTKERMGGDPGAEEWEKHPLRPWAKDKETLQQAYRPLSAFEVLRQHRQMVILGDPGSGKSTLTRRLAGVMAAVGRDDLPDAERDWQAQVGEVSDRWLLPVRLTLSRWAANLPQNGSPAAQDLIGACISQIERAGAAPNDRMADRFLARLTAKSPTALILLDGLDEVADPSQRQRLIAAIADFHACHPKVLLVVTCRVRPYRNDKEGARGQHFVLPLPDIELAKLDEAAIETFSRRWHDELAWAGLYDAETAAGAHRRLLNAVRNPNRGELRDMAGTPLLLTLMARVNYAKGLPDERAVLYKEFVDQMLYEWERLKLDDKGKPTSLELLLQQEGVDPSSFDRALSQLAYEVHDQGVGRDTVDIPRSQIEDAMRAIHPGDDLAKVTWATKVLQLMDARTGLVRAIEQGKVYQFTHRTFQEYLAARWLATGHYRTKFNQRLDDENWREAVFLALGYQISVQREYDNALWVLHRVPDAPTSAADWRRVLLLGEAYVRLLGPQKASEAEGKEEAAEIVQKMPRLLATAMQNPSLAARQRLDAGLLLARLDIDPPGLDDFIPALDQPRGELDEPPWGFHIARYPVTNKQFRRFIEAGGYEQNKQWWNKKAIENIEKYWSGWPQSPRFWDDDRFNHATQPVVGVSWYEANAYCAWLTAELRAGGRIGDDREVRLPTQAQWMQAAGKAVYPWGNDFNPAFANTRESGLGQTTPVHMYPGGQTTAGVWDMSGNVWEWTCDDDGDTKNLFYYLKGGSWYHGREQAAAAARSNWYPYYWYDGGGFRWVVVPRSS